MTLFSYGIAAPRVYPSCLQQAGNVSPIKAFKDKVVRGNDIKTMTEEMKIN
jgi:hypothetical protein